MGFWNNNDREESKPNWLTAAQKRFCVRTNRGWEVPQADGIANLANQFEGNKTLSPTGNVPMMELLVAMPNDPSNTGVTSSAFANRVSPGGSLNSGVTGQGGIAGDTNAPYAPYITCPFTGDSATVGGVSALGVSHSASVNYGLDGYGVSTLRWGAASLGMGGGTGYIKVKGNDVNFTNTLTISLVASVPTTNLGGSTGVNFVTNKQLLTSIGVEGPTGIPQAVYEAFFGPTSTYNNDIGILILPKGLTSGTYGATATISDGALTGSSRFNFTVL